MRLATPFLALVLACGRGDRLDADSLRVAVEVQDALAGLDAADGDTLVRERLVRERLVRERLVRERLVRAPGAYDTTASLADPMLPATPPAAAPALVGAAPPASAGSLGPLGTVDVGTPAIDRATGQPTPTPSRAELEALRPLLAVPVQGVARGELRDSFHEARGDGMRIHEALDILAPRGTPVLATTNGRVLRLFSSDNGGLMVYATDASERWIFMYGHLDRYADGLADGAMVRQGQLLGYVGTSGNAPANTPHLHFVVARAGDVADWWRGTPVDPRVLLAP